MNQSQSSGTSGEEFVDSLGEAAQRWARITEQSARVSAAFWERQADAPKDFQLIDAASVGAVFSALTASLMSNPDRLAEVTADYWRRSAELWGAGFRRMQGTDDDLPPMPADRRFRGEAWEANATFDYLRRSYLLASEWMHGVVESADIDPEQRRRAAFYTRQFPQRGFAGEFRGHKSGSAETRCGDRWQEPDPTGWSTCSRTWRKARASSRFP